MIIMLYNSWGLFFYKCTLALLDILGGDNSEKRMFWLKMLKLSKGKNKVLIYDSYINPQIKTFSIEQVKSWAGKSDLYLVGIVPPLNIKGLIKYASRGKKYFFRRKGILNLVLKLAKLIFRKSESDYPGQSSLGPLRTLAFHIIFFILGKGECQYLFERR